MFQKILQLIIEKKNKTTTTTTTTKTGLKGIGNFFSVDFNSNDNSDILDIHRYLMKGKWYKIMFGIIKKCLCIIK